MERNWRGGAHAEENALSFAEAVAGEQGFNQNHVQKRRKKQKGLEITFDPQAHKEFVTGFHKRKLQRKKDGQKLLEERAKKARLEERAQKRADLRARLDLGRYETDSDAEPANAKPAGKKDVQAYKANGMQAIVTVAPFSLNSDSEEVGSSDEEADRSGGAQAGTKQQRQKEKAPAVASGGAVKARKPKRSGTFSRYAGGSKGSAKAGEKGALKKKRRKR